MGQHTSQEGYKEDEEHDLEQPAPCIKLLSKGALNKHEVDQRYSGRTLVKIQTQGPYR